MEGLPRLDLYWIYRINQIGGCPKANAPAVSRVGGVANPVLPVPPLLAGDLPEALAIRVPGECVTPTVGIVN